MKRCPNCDADIEDVRKYCPFCGTPIKEKIIIEEPKQYKQKFNYGTVEPRIKNYNTKSGDNGSAGYWLIGFLFPVIGFILYCVWRKEQPNNAKSCLSGFITAIIVTVVLFVIFIVSLIYGLSGYGI